MFHFTCDRHGKELLISEDIRYATPVEIKSACGPTEIASDDLKNDCNDEILELFNKVRHKAQGKLKDYVSKFFKSDLGMEFQKNIPKDPLFKKNDEARMAND